MNIRNNPTKNFSRGLFKIDIPELGKPLRGKVRDSWIINIKGSRFRLMVTTDRQYAFIRCVCTMPGKGQILNLISAYWFNILKDIIPNHMIEIPHPNVIFAKQAKATLPVEVIVRRYMAKSITPTSIYHNYVNLNRREIYGIKFPNGLSDNQEFPMGTIITPTTKAKDGHDKELTDMEACEIVDNQLGQGTWNKVKVAAHAIFERGRKHCIERGLILADTKYEFGIDDNDDLMLIDEVHTPENSRFWLEETYQKESKEGIYKDVLNKYLATKGFLGKGDVPIIDPRITSRLLKAYIVPYQMITGKELPKSDINQIGDIVYNYIQNYK